MVSVIQNLDFFPKSASMFGIVESKAFLKKTVID